MRGEVEPALSAEEWVDVMIGGEWSLRPTLSRLSDDVELVDEDGSAMGRRATVERHRHALMAVANYALPNGHPGKITREDVALLREAAAPTSNAPNAPGFDGDPDLARIAAKLAALLPPEAHDAA